jgi:hypothetical protein
MFRDWQKTTNSIFCDGSPSSRRQLMDVGSAKSRNPLQSGANASWRSGIVVLRAPPRRAEGTDGRSKTTLTDVQATWLLTLHGSPNLRRPQPRPGIEAAL